MIWSQIIKKIHPTAVPMECAVVPIAHAAILAENNMAVKAHGIETPSTYVKKAPTPGSKTQKRKEGRKSHVPFKK